VTPLYTKTFIAIGVAHFLLAVPLLSSVPVLSWHIASALHGTRETIGWAMSAALLGGLVTRILISPYVDSLGRRTVFIGSGVLAAGVFPLYLLPTDTGLALHGLRVLHGAGMGALFPVLFLYAAEISPPARRIEGLAVFGSVGLIGLAIGPWLGERLAREVGFGIYCGCCCAVAGAGAVIAAACPDRTVPRPPASRHDPLALFDAFRVPSLIAIWIATMLWGIAFGTAFNFIERLVDARGLASVRDFFLPYGAIAVTLRWVGRSLPDRLGAVRVLIPSLAIQASGILLLAIAHDRLMLICAGLLCGVGHGYAFPALNALVVERSPQGRTGLAVNAFTIMVDLGQILFVPLAGRIAETIGFTTLFAAAGTLALAAAAVVLWGDRPLAQHSVIT
jgi:predicted MFS family arabinose efflux permease